MTNVSYAIDSRVMADLKESIGAKNSLEVTQEALSLLHWAVQMKKEGRVILTAPGVENDKNSYYDDDVQIADLAWKAPKH